MEIGQRPEVGSRRSEVRGMILNEKDLKVYQRACELAMEIFSVSKHWPSEERFSLTDQIRTKTT